MKSRINPFGDSSKSFAFFPSLSHKKGVHRIVRGLESNCGLILLTGEIGIGKTSLARHIQTYLTEHFVFVELSNPYQTPLEQLYLCCERLSLNVSGLSSIHDCVDQLEKHFHSLHAEGRRPVLIFDESHLLTKRHLSLIHILSNLRADDGPLVQILLVGQLEILDLLAMEGMEALNQRIGVRCELAPLLLPDTEKYIQFKLEKGGRKGEPSFSVKAVERIWRESGGLPRLVNHLCAHALDALDFTGETVVTPRILDDVCRDSMYSGMFQVRERKTTRRRWPLWAAAALLLVAAAAAMIGFAGGTARVRMLLAGLEGESASPVGETVRGGASSAVRGEVERRPSPAESERPGIAGSEEKIPETAATTPEVQSSGADATFRENEISDRPSALVETPDADLHSSAKGLPEAESVAGGASAAPPLGASNDYSGGDVVTTNDAAATNDAVATNRAAPGDEAGEPAAATLEIVGQAPPDDESGDDSDRIDADTDESAPKTTLPDGTPILDGDVDPVVGALLIGAIAWNEQPEKSIVVINSELIHEGDYVDGVKLLDIERGYVLVEYDNKVYRRTIAR